ncbi:hypothetical protein BU16DRAFT_40741 [Lophium mytilinum]|uniref:Secreted protein n=1 Tax=Lophium mytilinum TaxID=390894 RepID=A0A6A6QU68_9PEZI|nr:hypothetical protein BU16DRAFT_40741 [Lophium mytilinum]
MHGSAASVVAALPVLASVVSIESVRGAPDVISDAIEVKKPRGFELLEAAAAAEELDGVAESEDQVAEVDTDLVVSARIEVASKLVTGATVDAAAAIEEREAGRVMLRTTSYCLQIALTVERTPRWY